MQKTLYKRIAIYLLKYKWLMLLFTGCGHLYTNQMDPNTSPRHRKHPITPLEIRQYKMGIVRSLRGADLEKNICDAIQQIPDQDHRNFLNTIMQKNSSKDRLLELKSILDSPHKYHTQPIAGIMPIWLAIMNNNMEMVKWLLEKGKQDHIGINDIPQFYTLVSTFGCVGTPHKVLKWQSI